MNVDAVHSIVESVDSSLTLTVRSTSLVYNLALDTWAVEVSKVDHTLSAERPGRGQGTWQSITVDTGSIVAIEVK